MYSGLLDNLIPFKPRHRQADRLAMPKNGDVGVGMWGGGGGNGSEGIDLPVYSRVLGCCGDVDVISNNSLFSFHD